MRNRFDPNVDPLLETARSRLATAGGPKFWRSLEELAGTEEFQHYLHREFPENASEWTDPDPTSRRQFLRLMGASLALAGITGCGIQAPESIVPYVQQPENLVPGKPLFYASALPLCGGRAIGVIVETHEGRPTKIEGNSAHPASLGSTDPFAQGAILSLYDPDRSQVVTHNGRISTWDDFLTVLLHSSADLKRPRAARACDSSPGAVTSPSLAGQIQRFLKEFPSAKWHQYEPINRDNARGGAILAFGKDVEPIHHLERADVILSLDADFLSWNSARLPDSRRFAARRDATDKPNRLYVAEPSPTITGAIADHHLPATTGQVSAIAAAVAKELGVSITSKAGTLMDPAWVAAVVADLKAAPKGSTLVLAGEGQPAEVHAVVHAINDALGNIGKTIEFIEPIEAEPVNHAESLRNLVLDIEAKKVEALLILGGNPVYDALPTSASPKAARRREPERPSGAARR